MLINILPQTKMQNSQSVSEQKSTYQDSENHIDDFIPMATQNNETNIDSLELSQTSEPEGSNIKKNIFLGTLGVAVAWTVTALVIMVGRNPARAAKILKGSLAVKNEAYKEGIDIAKKIFSGEKASSRSVEKAMSIFKKPEFSTKLEQHIASAEKYIAEQGIAPDSEFTNAIKKLKGNLQEYVKKLDNDLIHGNNIDYELGQKFAADNKETIQIIEKELNARGEFFLANEFCPEFIDYNVNKISHVFECPKEFLPKNGIYFHGTREPKAVYKEGFTPFVSRQIDQSARELGAGVYTTPNERVAAYFSGLNGPIIPVKMAENSKIAMVTEASFKSIGDNVSRIIGEHIGIEAYQSMDKKAQAAIRECITRELFKSAGYDAAYLPKSVHGGIFLCADINEVIGVKQSQLVIYSPEKLEVLSRSLKNRILDIKEKFASQISAVKWQKEHPFGF